MKEGTEKFILEEMMSNIQWNLSKLNVEEGEKIISVKFCLKNWNYSKKMLLATFTLVIPIQKSPMDTEINDYFASQRIKSSF